MSIKTRWRHIAAESYRNLTVSRGDMASDVEPAAQRILSVAEKKLPKLPPNKHKKIGQFRHHKLYLSTLADPFFILYLINKKNGTIEIVDVYHKDDRDHLTPQPPDATP